MQGAGHVKRRTSGVSTGGVLWRVGSHCMYHDVSDGATKSGTVTSMYHGMSTMLDEFIVFEIEQKPITSYRRHYCLLSDVGHTTVFLMSNQVLWKCKALLFGGHTRMVLPIQSCTSEELLELR
jgi:hypothetical protein